MASALVDEPAQRHQVVVVAGGRAGEGVPLLHPAGHVVPDPFPQPVVVVARVVDRQESPVLGVEKEEQPVEEGQRRLTGLG